MGYKIERLLCWFGLHKWECETTREYAGDGEWIVRDHMRCLRLGCPRYVLWRTVNVERRRA